MKSGLRMLGVSLANRIVISAAGLSGLVTIGLVWALIRFSPDKLTVEGRQLFIASISIFCLAIGYLIWRKRRVKALVASINQKEGLSLDDTQLLGYPNFLFFAFDLSNKKLAQCQSVTGDYQIRDFTWVTGWQFEWQQIDSKVSGGVLQIVEGAGMNVPVDEIRRRFIRFSLVLTGADTSHPPFRFPMSRSAAEGWRSRCNVLFKC
jgi:hypothetical protein